MAALRRRVTVVCDTRMVMAGIPAVQSTRCFLDRVAGAPPGSTRTAAAIELAAREHPDGALWVIGNAPTALARLLELHDRGRVSPAAVVGLPVGYVGAAEAKAALWNSPLQPVAITNVGARGGSPVAAAAVNALAALAAARKAGPAGRRPVLGPAAAHFWPSRPTFDASSTSGVHQRVKGDGIYQKSPASDSGPAPDIGTSLVSGVEFAGGRQPAAPLTSSSTARRSAGSVGGKGEPFTRDSGGRRPAWRHAGSGDRAQGASSRRARRRRNGDHRSPGDRWTPGARGSGGCGRSPAGTAPAWSVWAGRIAPSTW